MNIRRGYRNISSRSRREYVPRDKKYVDEDDQCQLDENADVTEVSEPAHADQRFEAIMEELPLLQQTEKGTLKSNIRNPRQSMHMVLPKFIEDLQRFQSLLIDEDNTFEDTYIVSLENAVKSRCQKFTNDVDHNKASTSLNESDINRDNQCYAETSLIDSHSKDQHKEECEDEAYQVITVHNETVSTKEESSGSYCRGREKQEQISVISLLKEAQQNPSGDYMNNPEDQIQEDCQTNQFNLNELDDGSSGWDPKEMFDRNQREFGVKSSYSPGMEGYTTTLIRKDTPEYREKEKEAERITREIISSSQSRQYEDAENRDEEDICVEEQESTNESNHCRKDNSSSLSSKHEINHNKNKFPSRKKYNAQQNLSFDLSHEANRSKKYKQTKELERYDFDDNTIPTKTDLPNKLEDKVDTVFRLRSLAESVKKSDIFGSQPKITKSNKIVNSEALLMDKMSKELHLRNQKVVDEVASSNIPPNRKKMSTVASLKQCIPVRDHYQGTFKSDLLPWRRSGIESRHNKVAYEKSKYNQMQVDDPVRYNEPAQNIRSLRSLTASDLSLQSSLCNVSPSIKPANITALTLDEDVQVTCVFDPQLFYICRSINVYKRTKLEEIIYHQSFEAQPVINPLIGEVYIAHSIIDSRWYRAAVIKTQGKKRDECLIQYVDYGNVQTINKNRLRECPTKYSLKVLPSFSLKCGLWEISPARGSDWDTEAIATFKDLVEDVNLQLFVITISEGQGEPMYEVDLRLPVTTPGIANTVPSPIREVLVFLELAVYVNETQEDKFDQMGTTWKKKYFKQEIPFVEEECPVELGHSESPGCLFLHLKRYSKDRQKLKKQIQSHYNSAQVRASKDWNMLVPKVGMPCIAKYSEDKHWYRATIIDIPGMKMVDVGYIDYGNKERLWHNQIKVIHEDFMRLPAQAIRCHLYDVYPISNHEWDEGQHVEELNSFLLLVEGKNLYADFHNSENESCSVSITAVCEDSNSLIDIGSYLIDSGFAKSGKITESMASSILTISDSCNEIYLPRKKSYRRTTVFYDPYFQISSFPVSDEPKNKREQVIYVGLTDCYIHLQCKNRLKKFQEIQVTLENEIQQAPVDDTFIPEEGQFCVLSVDHKPFFARVKILRLNKDKAQVHLIDIGGIENVALSNLVPLPRKLLSERSLAIIVSLKDLVAPGGSAKWPLSTFDFMKSFLNHYGDDLYIVRKDAKFQHPIYNVKIIPVEMGWEIEEIGGPITPSVFKPISLNQLLVQEGYALRARLFSQDNLGEEHCIESLNRSTEGYALRARLVSQDNLGEEHCIESLNRSTVTLVDDHHTNLEYSLIHSDSTLDLEERQDPIGDTNPLPFMANQDDCIKQWLPAILPNKTEFTAIPSYVDIEGRIYLTLLADKGNLDEIDESQTMQYRDTHPSNADLIYEAGDMVIAQFHLNKQWCRATVLSVKDGITTVKFVDYGNPETVDAGGIRKGIIYKSNPILCHRCILNGVAPIHSDGRWTRAVLDQLHKKIVDHECRIQLVRPPKLGQDLHIKLQVINSKDHKDISDWLVDAMKVCKRVVTHDDDHFKLSSLHCYNETQNIDISLEESRDVIIEESSQSISIQEESVINSVSSDEEPYEAYEHFQPFLVDLPIPLPKVYLPKGEYFPVEIVSITSEYNMFIRPYVGSDDLTPSLKIFKKMKDKFNKHFPVENPLMRDPVNFPAIGKIYLALQEYGNKLLYRVHVLEVKNENVEVLFVDQGVRKVIPKTSLRECKPHEINHPVQCFKVTLGRKKKQDKKVHYCWSEIALKNDMLNHPIRPFYVLTNYIDDDGTPILEFDKMAFNELLHNRYLKVKKKFK